MLKTTSTRRNLVKMTGAAALTAGGTRAALSPRCARAQAKRKTLKILQWKHFIPGYDEWFNNVFAKEWGEVNDTEVIVENVGFGDLNEYARTEIENQRGHDLFQFVTPPAIYRDQVIDHREVYEECKLRHGPVLDFAERANYHFETKTYFGFFAAYQPALVTYRKSLWDGVRSGPNSWSDVLSGGRRIKLLHDAPVGFSLASEHNGEQTLRAVLYSFGASEQDEGGNPALKSKAALEAITYVKTLYDQAMTPDVLAWDGASNNRFMLTGEGCFTLDSLSIVRASETMGLPVGDDLRLAGVPEGPAGRFGSFGAYTYVIWKFAENVEGAKRFLADHVGASRQAFLASGFQNMPSFPRAVPDLTTLMTADAGGGPGRYEALRDAPAWTINAGYPGFTTPAVAEVYRRGLVTKMFAKAARGELTPEAALDEADRRARGIFGTWREGGRL